MLGRRAGLGGVRHDRLAGVGWQLEHVVVESEVADRWVVERLDAAAGGANRVEERRRVIAAGHASELTEAGAAEGVPASTRIGRNSLAPVTEGSMEVVAVFGALLAQPSSFMGRACGPACCSPPGSWPRPRQRRLLQPPRG